MSAQPARDDVSTEQHANEPAGAWAADTPKRIPAPNASHHDRAYRRLVLPDDLVTDQALEDAGGDEFHHAAIAKAVADLSLSSVTPVNIALFGPWGSGKSTFYGLMRKRIEQQDPRVAVVRYDAWKYGGHALKRNFIQDVAEQLDVGSRDFDRDLTLSQEQSRIRLLRWLRYNGGAIAGSFLIGLVVAAAWMTLRAFVDAQWNRPARGFWDLFPEYVAQGGLVLAGVLTALVLGPKALESAVVKTTRPAADRDDQFARMFKKLVVRIQGKHGASRVVFFIDELDRCEPDDVVATLVDLKTFLDEQNCVFIVAADRDVLEHALRQVPQAKPIRDDDPYYSTPGAFIDKIFQHQIALPPLRANALSSFAHGLVDGRLRGVWQELKTTEQRLFDDVIYILVPVHVTSPRRVKVLLNNYATSARIAESRHIDWMSRARELAVLTVLETEFPSAAAGLIRFPEMLAYLRGEKTADDLDALPAERIAVLKELDPDSGHVQSESVAGRIVRDSDGTDTADRVADDARAKRAKQELARQLRDYLGKLTVIGGLTDPRPDLLYLRVVGYDQGLTDPALGELIDTAADQKPDVVVAAFTEETPEIKELAVELLVRSLASQRGTGRANVLEAACRIAALLPHQQIARVAPLAPEVLAQFGQTSWRKAATPGALLLVSAQDQAAGPVTKLMDALDASDEEDIALLVACAPALEWMDRDAAAPVQDKIGEAIETDPKPLTSALSTLPLETALQLWSKVVTIVSGHFGSSSSDPVGLFDAIVGAVLVAATPRPLLWRAVVDAMKAGHAPLVEHIYERRDDLVPVLARDHQVLLALYQIEIGDEDHRDDWVAYLGSPEPSATAQMSDWAKDAALVLVKEASASTTLLEGVFDPVVDLISEPADLSAVFTAVVGQVPNVAWGSASNTEGVRWRNLRHMAQETVQGEEDGDRYAQAIADSLTESVEAELPTMTAAAPPAAIFEDWRRRIAEQPKKQATQVDQALKDLSAPTMAAEVERLRLRIAARVVADSEALTPAILLPVAGEPAASVMVGEWLELHPSVGRVMKVNSSIPIGSGPLQKYAAGLSMSDRTTFWVALEKGGASTMHLRAVGRHGVSGDAIIEVRPQILGPGKQEERNKAAVRLMTARFAEEPTSAEKANGETYGHKEAGSLALALVETKLQDNIILAGRIVVHSEGISHGPTAKLRAAFTGLANGKSSHNFTHEHAATLQRLGLLDVKKKGRMRWLYDKVADAVEGGAH